MASKMASVSWKFQCKIFFFSVIPHADVILNGKSINGNICMSQGHICDQNVNSKVNNVKICFLTNINNKQV